MLAKLTCSLALVVASASSVRANDITYNVSTGPVGVGATGAANVPKFDPALGVLHSVLIRIAGSVSGTWGIENTSNVPDSFGGGLGGSDYVGCIMFVTLPAGFITPPNPVFQPAHTPLAPFDGTLDYMGTSGVTFTFANAQGDGSPLQENSVNSDADLPAYVGSGNIAITIAPLAYGSSIPPSLQSTVSITGNASFQVIYSYEGYPAHVCLASQTSGCPCNGGVWSGGCPNSLHATGGILDALGTASISADSLVLSGTNMTNSSALYFQGSTFNYVQTVYGDGLRCVGGSIARLGTKINVSGVSSYPGPNDPSVSVRGGVVQAGLRYYQVVYRDGGNFCTSALFNATSGMAVLWTP